MSVIVPFPWILWETTQSALSRWASTRHPELLATWLVSTNLENMLATLHHFQMERVKIKILLKLAPIVICSIIFISHWLGSVTRTCVMISSKFAKTQETDLMMILRFSRRTKGPEENTKTKQDWRWWWWWWWMLGCWWWWGESGWWFWW